MTFIIGNTWNHFFFFSPLIFKNKHKDWVKQTNMYTVYLLYMAPAHLYCTSPPSVLNSRSPPILWQSKDLNPEDPCTHRAKSIPDHEEKWTSSHQKVIDTPWSPFQFGDCFNYLFSCDSWRSSRLGNKRPGGMESTCLAFFSLFFHSFFITLSFL